MSADTTQDDVDMVEVDRSTECPNPSLDMRGTMWRSDADIERSYFARDVQTEDRVSVEGLSLSQVLAERDEEIAKMSSQVERGRQEIASLTRRADFHRQMTQLWRKDSERKTIEYDDQTEQLKQTLFREELAQGMMIGAEKRLRDTESELKTTKDEIMSMRRIHDDKVSRLEKELNGCRTNMMAAESERWKLTGRVEEIIRDLDENHRCAM